MFCYHADDYQPAKLRDFCEALERYRRNASGTQGKASGSRFKSRFLMARSPFFPKLTLASLFFELLFLSLPSSIHNSYREKGKEHTILHCYSFRDHDYNRGAIFVSRIKSQVIMKSGDYVCARGIEGQIMRERKREKKGEKEKKI